ncbi:transposase [Streptomyces sp. NPDC001652]|uniref:transposase n=1 Tax=Streptomyces sp. NPDC001652 TaxID=3154393 RepID=UPI003329065A
MPSPRATSSRSASCWRVSTRPRAATAPPWSSPLSTWRPGISPNNSRPTRNNGKRRRSPGWPNQELSHQLAHRRGGLGAPQPRSVRTRSAARRSRCPLHALDDRVSQTRPGLTGGTRSEAGRARRRLQKTDQWQRHYATRAGVERTIAQGVRRCGLHRSRCVGLSKTRFTRAHRCRSPPQPNRRLTDRDLTGGLPHLPLQPPEPRMDTADVANGVPRGT